MVEKRQNMTEYKWSDWKSVSTRWGARVVREIRAPLDALPEFKRVAEKNRTFTAGTFKGQAVLTAWFLKPTSFLCPLTGKLIEEKQLYQFKPWLENAPQLKWEEKLLPEQIPATRSAFKSLQDTGRALLAWDTGTGKTYAACVIALNQERPTLVVCPAAVRMTWMKVALSLGLNVDVETLERVRLGKTRWWCKDNGWLVNNRLVILDEAHQCGGQGTLQCQVAESLHNSGNTTLWLSATLAKSIIRLRAFSKVFGLRTGGWQSWIKDQGARFEGSFNTFSIDPVAERNALGLLNQRIFPLMGSRLRMSDMATSFPNGKVDVYCADMSSREIATEYNDLEIALQNVTEKLERKALFVHVMQRIELLKCTHIVEMAQQHIEEGKSVAIFAQFTESVKFLCNALGLKGAIYGDTPREQRELLMRRFNDDIDHCIVCNIRAGGTGISLHGTRGARDRVALICPHTDADVVKQALGRVHRAEGANNHQYILFAEDTPEEAIAESLRNKLINMDVFNGDEVATWLEQGFDNIINKASECLV